MGSPATGAELAFSDRFEVYWSPGQDFVYISRRFYLDWEDVIGGRHDVFAIDPTEYAVQLTVGFKEGRPAFTEGFENFGDYYSLTGKSIVKFKYVEPLTFYFCIIAEDGREVQYPNHAPIPQVINVDSDSDSEPEEIVIHLVPSSNGINWDKVVTQRMVDGRDPLNLPAPVVEQLIQNGQAWLTVRVINTNLVEDCNIHRAKRNKHEAYLAGGWHGLCKALKLSVGDKLCFTFVQNELKLSISSISGMPKQFVIVV